MSGLENEDAPFIIEMCLFKFLQYSFLYLVPAEHLGISAREASAHGDTDGDNCKTRTHPSPDLAPASPMCVGAAAVWAAADCC